MYCYNVSHNRYYGTNLLIILYILLTLRNRGRKAILFEVALRRTMMVLDNSFNGRFSPDVTREMRRILG